MESSPPPPESVSAPPPPSMLSAPEPPVIVLADDVPEIETPVDSAEASTFWKFVTVTRSPEVWSAFARLTVTAVASVSVFVPVPPSIEVSEPR